MTTFIVVLAVADDIARQQALATVRPPVIVHNEMYRCPTCLTLFDGDCCPECGDPTQWQHDDANLWRNDGTPRRDIVVQPARRVYTPAHPFQLPEPAQTPAKRCPDCPAPHSACVADDRGVLPCEYIDNPPVDADSPDWGDWWAWQRRTERRFKIVPLELATFDGEVWP